ncbi:MAG TPA: hypothetical protein VLH85_08480 [Levilinea sp.]|nr:hypothetical protein [Levilinea sp.]
MKKWIMVILGLWGLLALAGCGTPGASPTTADSPPPAVQALERYLQALVEKDENTLVSLTCADWEMQALLEFDAFGGVEISLKELSCEQVENGDGGVTVVCQGKILASYKDEVKEFDLSSRNYLMVQQGGDWLVCGY